MGKEQEKRSKLYMQMSFHILEISEDSHGFKNKLIPGIQYTYLQPVLILVCHYNGIWKPVIIILAQERLIH